MSTPQEWYAALPPVSKIWFTAAITTALGARFSLLSPYNIALLWPQIVGKFQIWRLFTNFLFLGGPSFPWLITMIMMSRYLPALENDPFPSGGGSHMGNSADFLYMLMLGAAVLLPLGWLMNSPFMSFSLFFMVIYVWSRRHPDSQTNFYGFGFKASYLPWVLVAFSFIVGDDPVRDLLGIAAGHLYYFIQEVLPTAETPFKGRKLLTTPQWLYSAMQLPPTHQPAGMRGFRMGQPAQQQRRDNWGAGRVLGANN